MERQPEQTSHYIELGGGERLHLKRIWCDPMGPPLFMLHGAIENGRIFYSGNGKGLAPFLARSGFDVYVADLRGRGGSTPPISRSSHYGQTEAITEDIPAFINHIGELRGRAPEQWIAHSWGGVLLSSCMARYPEYLGMLRSAVYFGSKRSVRVKNIHRLLKVEVMWKRLCPLIAACVGYLPARQMRIGSDSETVRSLSQCNEWVKPAPWVDPGDGFDYGAAITKAALPPIWYIAAENDHALGHPDDVRDFMDESGPSAAMYSVLSQENGNLHDYDHISMLTHPDAVKDHFPSVVAWLQRYGETG